MKCPSCELNNLDHVERCVRCGALLRAREFAAEELTPKRGGARARLLRPLYRFRRRLGFRWNDGRVGSRIGNAYIDGDTVWGGFLLLVRGVAEAFIPSLYQFRVGRKIRGIVYLTLFLVALASIVILPGTRNYGWVIAFLALVQTSAFFDVYDFGHLPFVRRLGVVMLLSFFGFLGLDIVYSQVYANYVLGEDSVILADIYRGPEIYAGEVVRIVPAETYRAGELVAVAAQRMVAHGGRLDRYRMQGQWIIDRVLAVPGDKVAISKDVLSVNGELSPWRALSPETQMPDLPEQTLGEGVYLVFPSFSLLGRVTTPQLMAEVSFVGSPDIAGRIGEVIFPIWRRRALANPAE